MTTPQPRRTMVISPAPTANGDLHLGHIAGPFLAADVFTRFSRALKRETFLGTGMHFTQTFVVTAAKRLGVRPEDLREQAAVQVRQTLSSVGVEIDSFGCIEDRFVKMVLNFYNRLHSAGKLKVKAVRYPYSESTGEFLTDAYVRGGCPFCMAEGCAGMCETCSHPIAPGELINPRSTLDPDDEISLREVEVMVFPLEDHRAAMEEYFAAQVPKMRPRMAQLIEDLLSRPLPDVPITQPISWGIPAPFPETPGQTIVPDFEGMPWSMYCTAVAAEQHGAVLSADDELWYPEAGTRVVYFLGMDALYSFAVVGTTMLMALGGYVLPDQWITNEFYELANEKFSTSRDHLISARELATEVPRDLIRFHLASTSPEFQRTDFTSEALDRVTRNRLVAPWNRVVDKMDQWIGKGSFPISDEAHALGYRMFERFWDGYDGGHFSLTHAALTITEQLARLDRWEVTEADIGDFCHDVEVFLLCAAPILIDLAGAVLDDTTLAGRKGTMVEGTPVRLPRLTGVGD
jgi:methionyl-tRNA synthetase